MNVCGESLPHLQQTAAAAAAVPCSRDTDKYAWSSSWTQIKATDYRATNAYSHARQLFEKTGLTVWA